MGSACVVTGIGWPGGYDDTHRMVDKKSGADDGTHAVSRSRKTPSIDTRYVYTYVSVVLLFVIQYVLWKCAGVYRLRAL